MDLTTHQLTETDQLMVDIVRTLDGHTDAQITKALGMLVAFWMDQHDGQQTLYEIQNVASNYVNSDAINQRKLH
nr:hypothetical protein [uncultured Mediterranean phage uvMED]BAR29934.1 hypothetical protein [uncultured Mediterranean phage uvMED]